MVPANTKYGINSLFAPVPITFGQVFAGHESAFAEAGINRRGQAAIPSKPKENRARKSGPVAAAT
jgi:hypothetical protein